MPYFSIYALDRRPDGPEIRAETRPAHLEYIRRLGSKVKLAGRFMQHDGTTPAGSMIVIEADSIDEANDIAAEDPYAKAGLFASVDVRLYQWVVNPPEQP